MKLVSIVLGVLVAIGVAPTGSTAHEHDHGNAKPTTLVGEVVDLQCFIQHPENATGVEHAKCAQACMAKGLPIGFLADDGTVYQLVGPEHEPIVEAVSKWAGKKCSLTGMVIEHHGIKAIELASITDVSTYVCSMHPEVRQGGPGECPKCGMALVIEKK